MTPPIDNPQALSGNARGSIPLAPQGWPFILATLALLLISVTLQWSIIAILLLAVVFVFVLNFFRDFERDTPQSENLYIAPADGKVIRAESTEDGLRVDIFMNVFDVHVNRAPMPGKIIAIEYTEGKFVNASFDNASTENERNRFEMETSNGMKISFTQISGLIARRIISYVSVGDKVAAGQRIGMIRFGSRVDCIIPKGFALNVKLGDRVSAATSILARRKES